VQRAAAKWVRVQHQRYAARLYTARLFQDGFKLTVRSLNEEIASRIHKNSNKPESSKIRRLTAKFNSLFLRDYQK
jgi:hypothetical protein